VPRTPPRAAVLVVRVWLENGGEPKLRGRLTQTLDVATAKRVVTAAGNEDDIYHAVRTWVRAFLRRERTTCTTDQLRIEEEGT
jgi:hypothetical protein